MSPPTDEHLTRARVWFRCEKSREGLIGRFVRRSDAWWLDALARTTTAPEQANTGAIPVSGILQTAPLFPGCAACQAPSFAQCSTCSGFGCSSGPGSWWTCPWCGNAGEIVLKEHFDLNAVEMG